MRNYCLSKLLPSCQKLIENIVEPKIEHNNNQFSDLLNMAPMSTYFLDEKIKYIPGKKIRFSEKTQMLISGSTTLSRALKTMEVDGWKLVVAQRGQGTATDLRRKTVFISSRVLNHPNLTIQALSHEIGHIFYTEKPNIKSKSNFISYFLASEGAATIKNIEIQREIINHMAVDIGIMANPRNIKCYNEVYDNYLIDNKFDEATKYIGEIYRYNEITSNNLKPYGQYYNEVYNDL
uniref:Uncharacterized protein n=2 Tax=Arsenophonus nasoniae TaxID=638 RepID=D2U3K5_9GAMM|nr:conserved hypothetical protein [Arsenophonus nasoniae]